MSRVRTVVATEMLTLLGLAGFVGVTYLVERIADLNEPLQLNPVSAIVLSALPALLWLGYFYSQDRHEPEPKHYVAAIYLLGVFVAGPVSSFAIEGLTAPQVAGQVVLRPLAPERIVVAFLIVGLAQELGKYLIVRYTIYLSPEFDEPMDGVVYMTAAGLGLATHENYRYLQGLSGEVFLSSGAATVVITTLAHACFAGAVGYALGRAKFATFSGRARTATLLLGLLSATVLSGAFQLVHNALMAAGMTVTPWRGVMFTFGFAALVFLALSVLMQRLLAESPHRSGA